MLLMVDKRGVCHPIYWHAKANKKHMKNYDKNKESLYLKYIWLGNIVEVTFR